MIYTSIFEFQDGNTFPEISVAVFQLRWEGIQTHPLRPATAKSPKARLCASMGAYQCSQHFQEFWNCSINAERYSEALEQHVLPSRRHLFYGFWTTWGKAFIHDREEDTGAGLAVLQSWPILSRGCGGSFKQKNVTCTVVHLHKSGAKWQLKQFMAWHLQHQNIFEIQSDKSFNVTQFFWEVLLAWNLQNKKTMYIRKCLCCQS